MNFKTSKTRANLARAFAGECQDGARYQFIAKAAQQEGFEYLANMMRTLAKNEMAHAWVFYNHLLQLTDKNLTNIELSAGYPFEPPDLKESLASSAGVELSEAKNIYPSFAKIAKDEGYTDVAQSFIEVARVENTHYVILTELDKKFKTKKLYKAAEKQNWKCSNCGYTEEKKEAWNTCPLCSHPQGYVMIKLEEN